MNSYQGAKKIEKLVKTEYAEDIKWRSTDYSGYGIVDGPTTYGKGKWNEMGLGGGDGSGIVWEGFYDWTKPVMIEKMEKLLEGTGLKVFPTAEWMVEIF